MVLGRGEFFLLGSEARRMMGSADFLMQWIFRWSIVFIGVKEFGSGIA